jgi:hypothetical protein
MKVSLVKFVTKAANPLFCRGAILQSEIVARNYPDFVSSLSLSGRLLLYW